MHKKAKWFSVLERRDKTDFFYGWFDYVISSDSSDGLSADFRSKGGPYISKHVAEREAKYAMDLVNSHKLKFKRVAKRK